MKNKHILFLIRSLESGGGAERQLLYLANELSNSNEVSIITFYDNDFENSYIEQIQDELECVFKFKILSLKKRGRYDFIAFLHSYIKTVNKISPDYIYSFMNVASIISVLGKIFNKKPKLIFGIRASNMSLFNYGLLNYSFSMLEKYFSRFADLVICNSYAGKKYLISKNYKCRNIHVIHNGINSDFFRLNIEERNEIRSEFNIPIKATIIGIIARHDKMKGIEYFIQAAFLFLHSNPNVYFFIIGSGPKKYSKKLQALTKNSKFSKSFIWHEKSNDIRSYHALFDIFTSSSIYGEGFPNVLAESLLCENICVATDVGDSSFLLKDVGFVVDPCNSKELCEAWSSIMDLSESDREEISKKSRSKVLENFSIKAMTDRTIQSIDSLKLTKD